MNIFIVSFDPVIAAQSLCDKHVVKMILESAQLLCTAHSQNSVPYKHTHVNHPCAKWVRESLSNYAWLEQHAIALCNEYSMRYYYRTHKTEAVLRSLPNPNLPDIGLTPFALAMPDEYKQADAVQSYREYYKYKAKTIDFRYTNSQPPDWLF